MKTLSLLGVAVLLFAPSAFATEPTPTAPAGGPSAAVQAQVVKKEPSTPVEGVTVPAKICRKVTGTGSRVSREKICKTQAEWSAHAKRRTGGSIVCEGDSECNRGSAPPALGGG